MKLKKVLEENYKSKLALLLIVLASIFLLVASAFQQNRTTELIGPEITDNSIITIEHQASGSTLNLEVASTEQKRETGLMYRKSLEENGGMFFIFSKPDFLSFWMKNTSISLDMIFLDKDLKVTSIFSDTKIEQIYEIYNAKLPSQYVIETLAGWAQKKNVHEGDLFKIAGVK